MSETPKAQNQEAFNAFVKQYNLDPLNKDAINNCLFDLLSMIKEVAKHIKLDKHPECDVHIINEPKVLIEEWNK